MGWKPNRWLAAFMSFLITPLGLLYVQRPRWALGYFLLSLVMQVTAIGGLLLGFTRQSSLIAMLVLSWSLSVLAAVHAFRIGTASAPAITRHWYSRWYGLTCIPIAFFVLVFLLRAFLYEPFHVPSQAMHPTLPEGSLVFVRKLGYGDYGTFGTTLWRTQPTAAVARGDLILFRLVDDPQTVYVKRVIGMPGDRVECRHRQLVINGALVPTRAGPRDGEYDYASETIDGREVSIAYMAERPGRRCDEVVPEAHYFVLGDSRDNSRDSRYFGMVPRANLVGRVVKAIKAEPLVRAH